MHRFLYLARPRHDLTLTEFHQRWRAHAQLAATCPDVLAEIRGYRQWAVVLSTVEALATSAREALVTAADVGVVGVAETRCADAAAVYRMLECAGTRNVLQPDELRFLSAPCRATGLVADDTTLCAAAFGTGAAQTTATAQIPLNHACLWLAPRRPAAPAASTTPSASAALEERVAALHGLFSTAVASANSTHKAIATPGTCELSLGQRDAADTASPFAALLFARFANPATAERVAAAWRAALLPGENVWLLQRAARHLGEMETVP